MPEQVEFKIEEVVELDPADDTTFTPEHKTFLEEHKDELTTDELKKFGFEVEAPKLPEIKKDDEPDLKKKDDNPADPDDTQAVEKMVDKKLSPILKQNQDLTSKLEINSFLTSKPEYEKYRDAITTYKNHPNYANVPVDQIANMVAAPDLMKMGARKERETQEKANNSQTKANTARKPAGQQKDWGAASKEDFAAKRAEVLGRPV